MRKLKNKEVTEKLRIFSWQISKVSIGVKREESQNGAIFGREVFGLHWLSPLGDLVGSPSRNGCDRQIHRDVSLKKSALALAAAAAASPEMISPSSIIQLLIIQRDLLDFL